jgi:hypothetical protein
MNTTWFLVETNYDHWKAPLFIDDRVTPANKCMNELGQSVKYLVVTLVSSHIEYFLILINLNFRVYRLKEFLMSYQQGPS